MKKRLLMILTFSVLLVGCSNQQETNNPSTDQPTTTESTSTTEPTSTPTEAPTTTEEPTEPPHEHAYTEAITTEATCEADGVKTFTCDCGDSYTEVITATGHNYETVTDSEVSATCTNDGKEADTKCSLCNDVISGAVIPALSHSYGDYAYNNDATYEKDGTETATCSACGDKKTRTKSGTKLVKEETGDPLNVEGLPFVPFQVYDEGDTIYYWYPLGAYEGYGTFSEQKKVAYNECEQIMQGRYNSYGSDGQYEDYFYECSWGNAYKDGKRYVQYAKFTFYAIN